MNEVGFLYEGSGLHHFKG